MYVAFSFRATTVNISLSLPGVTVVWLGVHLIILYYNTSSLSGSNLGRNLAQQGEAAPARNLQENVKLNPEISDIS